MSPKEVHIKHVEAVAALNYLLVKWRVGAQDVIKMGKHLINILDQNTKGYWIWDIAGGIEFYSPNFRKTLGYESEEDFPNVPESWQKAINPEDLSRAIDIFNRHLQDPEVKYYLEVEYNKKNGGKVNLICAGTVVNRDNPDRLIMIGTHEVTG